MVQDEVSWVLDTIRSNWPGSAGGYGGGYGTKYGSETIGWPTDDDGTERLYRVNRDEPRILETDKRTMSVELSKASAIGASLANRSSETVGSEYDHRVETVVGCRLEGLTTTEWGHIESPIDAETLVRHAQYALLSERSYPAIGDAGDGIGSVAYHSLFVENETSTNAEYADHFRADWDVRLVGYSSLP